MAQSAKGLWSKCEDPSSILRTHVKNLGRVECDCTLTTEAEIGAF